jgi:DNA polymerase III epsilon subunit-like protein
MQLLFFDTETSWFANAWWRVIQFWAIYWLYDKENDKFYEERTINQYIDFDWNMSPGAFAVHWITKEQLKPFKKMDHYINEILAYINKSDYIVCHNVWFDLPFLQKECEYCWVNFDWKNVQTFCTMANNSIKEYMGTEKRPKLQELHQKVFGKWFKNAHDAMADIKATKDVFIELYKNDKIVLF